LSKSGPPPSKHAPAPVAPVVAAELAPLSPFWNWLQCGAILLFLAAAAYGVLEVHSSTDTWIGLAAGRQIMSSEHFPRNDTFSYTSGGNVWYNQNWLSHVFFWLIYDKLGRTATVWATWAVSYCTFSFVLLATWFRARSWLAATLAAALVAISCRDWLSIRPATIQFFCLALEWMCLSALVSGRPGARWWPIALLFPLFVGWAQAHGSFEFGYAMIALLIGTGVFSRIITGRMALTWPQIFALLAVCVVTLVLGAVLSPYGIDNYLHPLKVTNSPIFRQVGEWLPPYIEGKFPPVLRFWLGVSVAGMAALVALALRAAWALQAEPTPAARPQRPFDLHLLVFDVAAVVLGFSMAMFARRFAPVFFILTTPALVRWVLRLAPPAVMLQREARRAFIVGAWLALPVTIFVTRNLAIRELNDVVPGEWDLLDRITRNDASPHDTFEWLNRNALAANVMTEWKIGGIMMFYVPAARVFIDGRSQQVYSEDQYKTYVWLLNVNKALQGKTNEVLGNAGTDLVVMPRWATTRGLQEALEQNPEWLLIYETPGSGIWARRAAPLFRELGRREAAGELWWPDSARMMFLRGALLVVNDPSYAERAKALWREAINRDVDQVLPVFKWYVRACVEVLGQREEAAQWLREQRQRFNGNERVLRAIDEARDFFKSNIAPRP
jgi:hypothetical protein